MTEAEWLACTDPRPMLKFLAGKASDRKLRLFALACCRRIRDLLPDARSRWAIEMAGRFADGRATEAELERASDAACAALDAEIQRAAPGGAELDAVVDAIARTAPSAAYTVTLPMGWWGAAPAFVAPDEIARAVASDSEAEGAAQSAVLRDVFENPFRPVTMRPPWLSPAAVGLAAATYDGLAFDRTPELADALEQAGCTNSAILEHCRGPGPHVRGCWVIDLVLGKS